MAPALEQVFTIRLYRSKKDTLVIGRTRGSAMHVVTPYESGFLRSAQNNKLTPPQSIINASLVQGSANSVRLDPHAVPVPATYLDARIHFRDETLGAAFHVRFEGVARMDDQIQKILDGEPDARTTESWEHYEFNHPIFEVSREEDRWMEATAWVGHGHYVVKQNGAEMDVAVEFEVYRLLTG